MASSCHLLRISHDLLKAGQSGTKTRVFCSLVVFKKKNSQLHDEALPSRPRRRGFSSITAAQCEDRDQILPNQSSGKTISDLMPMPGLMHPLGRHHRMRNVSRTPKTGQDAFYGRSAGGDPSARLLACALGAGDGGGGGGGGIGALRALLDAHKGTFPPAALGGALAAAAGAGRLAACEALYGALAAARPRRAAMGAWLAAALREGDAAAALAVRAKFADTGYKVPADQLKELISLCLSKGGQAAIVDLTVLAKQEKTPQERLRVFNMALRLAARRPPHAGAAAAAAGAAAAAVGEELLLGALARLGLAPDRFTHHALLAAAADRADSERALQLFASMLENEIEVDNYCYTAIISACAADNNVDSAQAVFDHIKSTGLQPSVCTYTALIGAHLANGTDEGAGAARALLEELHAAAAAAAVLARTAWDAGALLNQLHQLGWKSHDPEQYESLVADLVDICLKATKYDSAIQALEWLSQTFPPPPAEGHPPPGGPPPPPPGPGPAGPPPPALPLRALEACLGARAWGPAARAARLLRDAGARLGRRRWDPLLRGLLQDYHDSGLDDEIKAMAELKKVLAMANEEGLRHVLVGDDHGRTKTGPSSSSSVIP